MTMQQQLTQLADTLDIGFGGLRLPARVVWLLVTAQALLTLFAGVHLLRKGHWWTAPAAHGDERELHPEGR